MAVVLALVHVSLSSKKTGDTQQTQSEVSLHTDAQSVCLRRTLTHCSVSPNLQGYLSQKEAHPFRTLQQAFTGKGRWSCGAGQLLVSEVSL